VACARRRLISVIDDDSSSPAAASVRSFSEVIAEADDTARVLAFECARMPDIDRAVRSISTAAEDSVVTTSLMLASKLSASAANARRFSCLNCARVRERGALEGWGNYGLNETLDAAKKVTS
jgi:hypothetical protein